MVEGLRALGVTVVLTTQHMEEAETLADRIAVIAGGEIAGLGTPGTVGGRDTRAATITFTLARDLATSDLPAALHAVAAREPDGTVVLQTDAPLAHLHALTGWALARGLALADLEVRRPALEDVYLGLTEETPG